MVTRSKQKNELIFLHLIFTGKEIDENGNIKGLIDYVRGKFDKKYFKIN